jgi:non-specific serine/threonine protein kinase
VRSCPSVRLLATSQEALGAPGETVWTVPPLSLPDPGRAPAADELAQSEAARLFVERAKLSNPRFELTEQNAAAVARVCRSLDGIPLALELAAARVKMLTVEQIAERLDDRFRLLTGGGRTTELRQRTLRGAMEWSYELLSGPERTFFGRVSVFAGGFMIESAEAACAGGDIDEADVFDLLSRLVDKSLLVVDEHLNASRYRMLQTVRQYGRERLEASGEADLVGARHRDLFLALAEEAEVHLSGPDQAAWLARLDLEHDNLRAALEWSRGDAATSDAFLRLAGALPKFWYVRNYEREGIRWLEDALAADRDAAPGVRAKALAGAGSLARVLRDYARANALFEESLALRRAAGDAAGVANSLNNLGIVAQWQDDLDRAELLLAEALSIAREAKADAEVASALNNLGVVARFRGDHDSAEGLFEESLALYRALGDKRYVAGALNNLGVIAGIRGDYELSARLQEEHLALRRELGGRRGIAAALNNLGETMLRKGEHRRARSLLRESLALYKSAGDMRGLAYLLESFVSLAAAEGRAERALRLAGATAALREAIGSPLSEPEREEMGRTTEAARAEVGDAAAEAAVAAGRAMTTDEALAFALASPAAR